MAKVVQINDILFVRKKLLIYIRPESFFLKIDKLNIYIAPWRTNIYVEY